MIDTKEKILDAAERLVGEQGYAATSLRQIIAEAGVNLAAVHYHFGSKEGLLDAVVVRKAIPVNEARLAQLDRVEAAAGSGPLDVEKVLECFFMPALDVASRSPEFVRLIGRMLTEGLMPQIVERHFQAAGLRFLTALRRATPGLPQEELIWRIHFTVGAMAHAMCGPPTFPWMRGDPEGTEPRMKRLVTFLSAGFRAARTADKEE